MQPLEHRVLDTPVPASAPAHVGDRPPANAMSVDVEEHFQVAALEPVVRRDDWDRLASRVERNVDAILDLFARHGVRATFFTLAWVAERHPGMVRRIVADGHELASHGCEHVRVHRQTPDAFRDDVRRSKAVLEDIGGVRVRGYRAASFSLTRRTGWAHAILDEEGYAYSSSIYPIRHDLYGIPDAPRFAYAPNPGSGFREIPITTVRAGGRHWPAGGGGYFRLLPYAASAWSIGRVNAADRQSCVFYFHPWEVDPEQPRVAGLPARSRIRHYLNLSRMRPRLERLARDFAWDRMDRVFGLDGPDPALAEPALADPAPTNPARTGAVAP